MESTITKFIEEVSAKSSLQRKYLHNVLKGENKITDEEQKELESVIDFFIEIMHYNLEQVVDAYLFINNMVMEETYFFVQNGRYRYSTFEEVDKIVYANPEYMSRYMCGLTISDYFWVNHISMLRFYSEWLKKLSGKRYLEIGPGFGQFLIRAMQSEHFEQYLACDVSDTSVNSCKAFMKYRGMEDKCEIVKRNFFDFADSDKSDLIVCGEVLEHVEDPASMLQKIYELLSEDGTAFVTTVINAPTIDHIYLFNNINEVLDLAQNIGFHIKEYKCATAGDISIEKAEKKKRAINIALVLGK